MRLCRKVYDAVNPILLHQGKHEIEITDICLDKHIIRPILDIGKIGKVARIGQLVDIDDTIVRILVYKQTYYMAADEAGTSCNDYVSLESHILFKHFFSESVQCGTDIPNAFFILVLSSTEYDGLLTGLGYSSLVQGLISHSSFPAYSAMVLANSYHVQTPSFE